MLDKIKTSFSISDLENLTGISVHTIRIWERRYDLLKPGRTDSNIRLYDSDDLKKLLNIATLYQNGYKISKLALLSEKQLAETLSALSGEENNYTLSINAMKMSMLAFDKFGFDEVYNELSSNMSFSNVYVKVILPLLDNIGSLWQTNSITPPHEHFISNIIRQKLLMSIEKLPLQKPPENKLYLLFLPTNELHELSLLFIHYKLLLHKKHSIYLGQSVETHDLIEVRKSHKGPITYVSCLTVYPETQKIESFLSHFNETLLNGKDKLWLTGRKLKETPKLKTSHGITVFGDVGKLLDKALVN